MYVYIYIYIGHSLPHRPPKLSTSVRISATLPSVEVAGGIAWFVLAILWVPMWLNLHLSNEMNVTWGNDG